MKCALAGTLALLLGLSVAMAGGEGPAKPATPAEQYKALLKEYHIASADFRKAETDQERKSAVERLDKFALGFLELAEKNPKNPIVLEALLQVVRVVNAVDSLSQTAWEMNRTAFPSGSKNNAADRAVAILVRDHVRSDRLGLICERMRYGVRKEYETLLRTVLETNPHKEVQALACQALAQFLNHRLQRLDLVKERMANLTDGSGSVTRANDNHFLRLGIEVLDDNARDVLRGGVGRNWLFSNS